MSEKLYLFGGAYPAPLPFRVTLSNGNTRTDPLSFTDEEIADAGYTLAPPIPEYDPTTQRVDWINNTWVVSNLPPSLEPEPIPAVVYKLDLFERSTEDEAEQIVAAIGQQSARIRMIFEAAQSFHEDHELWTLLSNAATQMFGADRAAELLAPSEG